MTLMTRKLSPIVVNCDSNTFTTGSTTPDPRANHAIRVYMNDLAAKAYRTSAATYPVGSVIVKEKLAAGGAAGKAPTDAGWQHVGVGGMIKRTAGYDPDGDNWEYFCAKDTSRKVESGRIANCALCHAGEATRDHVFGGWTVSQ